MNPANTQTRWMLVDDNRDILFMESIMLDSLTSATIECYSTPQEALAAFRASPQSYELVITDLEMPGMDGMELCRHLRAVTPGQKVILATGSGFFTEAAARHAGFSALLDKPFPVPSLKAALAKALGVPTKKDNFFAGLVAV